MGKMMSPRGNVNGGAQQDADIEKGNARGEKNDKAIYQLDSDQGIHRIERRPRN